MSDYRTCSNCSYPKPLCEFPKHRLKFKFGYVCKECKKAKLAYRQSEESKTKKEYLAMYGTLSRQGVMIKKRRKMILEKLGNACVGCGITVAKVLYVVRQDGKPSPVKFSGDGLMRKLEDILSGLSKMELRCSNCQIIKLAK